MQAAAVLSPGTGHDSSSANVLGVKRQQSGSERGPGDATATGSPMKQQQHDRSHLTRVHELSEAEEQQPQQQQDQQEQQHGRVEEQEQQHKRKKHKSSGKEGGGRHHLSFEDEVQEEEEQAVAAAAADASTAPQQQQQQHWSGMGQATAAKFKAEKRQATAARLTFHPSSAADAGPAGQQQQQPARLGIVDEDSSLQQAAPAGLSQIHFGKAQARGARPYMEDRHCIVTALKPASGAAGAAATSAAADGIFAPSELLQNGSLTPPHPAAAAAGGGGGGSSDQASTDGRQQQQPQQQVVASVADDGVARCYAAIFDGHNGAGAAETAARQLHVLLAGHPALRIFKGDHGPPAVVKQEEAAVGRAIKQAFKQVDDLVLAVARRDGTRDGATALMVLRLGGALYAAHAGDSRAVLCRDGQAHRLTEDHKPHLPQERQRIEDAGGRVDFQRCWRVVVEPRDGRPGSGLAVSRSLGDLDFKEPSRFVECDPDVTRLTLLPHKDSFVILGSDGLWDVLSDTDAVATAGAALKAFTQEHQRNSSRQLEPSPPPPAAAAAAAAGATPPLTTPQQQQQQRRDAAAGGGGGSSSSLHGRLDLPTNGLVYSDAAATAAAEALLRESMRRGTMDNVTVIVMLLQWE